MKVSLYEVAKVVGVKNNIEAYDDVTIVNIEFDSRKIGPGDLFLPLKGERDGHTFIPLAFENGACATFSEKELSGFPYLLVDDCLKAFQDLAHYYLEKMRVDVIAVTGSNGKTTTKDMIAEVLSTTYKTYKTQGNYNNEIGLPYTVCHMPDDTEKIVLEMGQDHLGDISLLSQIAQPHLAVVTMIGEAHLEFFGSRGKIAEGKLQIVDGMTSDGIVLLPNDPIVNSFLPDVQKVIRFGEGEEIHLETVIEERTSVTFTSNVLPQSVTLPIPGKYNATNALVAACVGKLMAVSDSDIIEALESIVLTQNRTEWKKAANGADILSDVYNANPTAMRLILETFSNVAISENGKKIAVLADMKELGDETVLLHNRIIESLNPDTIDVLIFYGDVISELAQIAREKFPENSVYYFLKTVSEDQFTAMVTKIKELLEPSDQILLKGSHSMQLSKVVEQLEGND